MIGPNKDIPAPDVNTNPQIMAWIMDTYSMNVGYSVPGVVTGKPIVLGGSEGRSEATGRGCVYAIEEAAPTSSISTSRKSRTVVQGFGNAGSVAARLMAELGSTVVGVSDSRGGIYNPNGLDLAAVRRAQAAHRQRRRVHRRPRTSPTPNCWCSPCDILIPAAMENQIDRRQRRAIQARLIAEAANGPTTPEADEILLRPGRLRRAGHPRQRWWRDRLLLRVGAGAAGVPLDRAGGQRAAAPDHEPLVRSRLRAQPVSHDVHMRTAALVRAIDRVAEFTRLRGIYP